MSATVLRKISSTCLILLCFYKVGALLDRDEYLLLGKREAREDPMRGQVYF